MHSFASLDPALGFIVGIAISILVLLALELFNNRRITRLTAPIYEFATERAEAESERILKEAKEQARKILLDAESAALALSTSHQKEYEQAEKSYQGALQSMLKTWEGKITEEAKSAQTAQIKLGDTAVASLNAETESARAEITKAIAALEEEFKSRMEREVNAAVAAAKADAAKSEELHKNTVDAHIMALIRETLRITLQRELPKETHAELVRAALEEAKANGIF